MSTFRINKIDAARRQIDAAIRMTFLNEDPIAILAVIAGPHRIIRDICEARGDIDSYKNFKKWIAPGHEAEFWRHWNATMNFIKHADNDASGIIEVDDENSDFLIVLTSKWFVDLGNASTQEMRHFAGWYAMQHPGYIDQEALDQVGQVYSAQFAKAVESAKLLNRQERIAAARMGLEAAGIRLRP